MSFNNKVVIVTGANNGIGKEINYQFSKQGAITVVLDKDIQKVKCDFYYQGDIAHKEVLESFSREVIQRYKKIDVLVNNACLSKHGILSNCSYEDFQYVIKVGAIAPYYLTLLFKDYFSSNASIINISSTRAAMSQPNTESYTSAKGAISALTHSLAVSLAGKVRVNSISPGWIKTTNSVLTTSDCEQHLTKTVGKTQDIANMTLFLASEKASFITGENITIDGGMSKQMIYHNDYNWIYDKKGE